MYACFSTQNKNIYTILLEHIDKRLVSLCMAEKEIENNSNWGKDLFVLLALSFILYFALAWMRPLASPDEGRYSEIPLEMIRAADYITPTLNDMAYFYKPPLFYWLTAGSIKIFGENIFGFRFANTALALLGIAFTYCAARALYGRLAGIFSSIILGTSIFYFALGQIITLDMAVSVFIAGAMFSFIVALKRSGIWRGFLILLFFFSSALAVMSKGLIGVLIPAATIFLFALAICVPTFFRKLKLSDLWWSIGGLILFFIVAVPWHVFAAIANPSLDNAGGVFSKEWEGQGFFWYYIIHEHILRFIDSSTSMRAQPFWYFLVLAPLGFIPHLFFLPSAVKDPFVGGYKKLKDENSEIIFFALWAIFVVLFFSISSSKLPPYILPIYPALAIIVGRWFAKIWETEAFSRLNLIGKILLLGGYAASIAPLIIYFVVEHKGKLMEKAPEMLVISIGFSILMAFATSVALYFLIKKNYKVFWSSVVVAICVLLSMVNPLGKYLQRESARELVDKIADLRRSDDIYMIGYSYNIFQDFPVWLGQTVYTIGEVPEEQKFGYMRARSENEGRFIDNEIELKKLLAVSKGNVYVAVRDNLLEHLKKDMKVDVVEVARARNLLLVKILK